MNIESLDPVGALSRSWWVVVITLVVGAVAVGGATVARQAHYTSTAAVAYYETDPSQALLGAAGGGQGDVARALHTQLRVVVADTVLDSAAAVVGLDPTDLSRMITVELEPDSNVIRVRGTADTAGTAQQITSAVVNAYAANDREAGLAQLLLRVDTVGASIESLNGRLDALPAGPSQEARRAALAGQVAELAQQQEQLRSAAAVYPGHVSVLSAADLPRRPSSPDPISGTAAGAGLGLVLGLVVAVLRAPARRPAPRPAYPTSVPRARHRGNDPTPFADTRAS